MKKVSIQNEREGYQNDIGSETKILHINSKSPYDKLQQERKNNSIFKSFSFCFEKIFLIRAMLIIVSLTFCYYLILLIQKGSKIYKNQNTIYLQKDLSEIELNEIKSPQLINEKNIRIIKELNISLKIEHSKYVHLKIIDKNNKRWEVPQEILNEEYFKTIYDNYNSNKFKIESLISEKDFNFNLYYDTLNQDGKIGKNIFFSFDVSKNFLFSDNYINFESHLTSDDIFGFGERIHNFKLNEGLYTIWPIDQSNIYDEGKGGQNLYGHQPIALHKTKYKDIWLGFIFLNSNAQDVKIYTKDNETIISHKTIGGIIDYYIIVDNSPENILRDIHYLIGKPILPPYWALGNHQCRWGFQNYTEFKNVYETYKMKGIPIDAMWIDIDSMDHYQIFTLNKNEFKELPEYIDNVLHKDKGYFIPIIDIGISYNKNNLNEYAKKGDEYDLFIKSGYSKKNLMGKVWPGKTVFPDFFNPDIYLIWDKGLTDYYNIIKYDGIWLDMNEISNLKRKGNCPGEIMEGKDEYKCNIVEDMSFSYLPGYKNNKNLLTIGSINMNGITFDKNIIYNNKPLISVYQSKQTYNYLKKNNKRPFILSRSNSFGSGKYSFHWLGDNYSQNKYIEYSIAGIFNYNIFGIPFTGADICGFNDNANGKLCARWYNVGAFYPFSRNHNSKNKEDQYPWSFGEEIEKKIKKDIKYRYSLLRYFYSQLFLISLNEKGSFFKPILFEFPDDKYSYEDIESKIMIGEAILICAFFDNEENDRDFILPNSNFNLYPSGEIIIDYSSEDNINLRKKTLSGKISDLHIFLRGGYIIPMQNTFEEFILNTYNLKNEKLNLIINPDNEGNSKGVIFFDNDGNDVIENNRYFRVDLEFKNKILYIKTNITDSDPYKYKDHILNRIEIWRIGELFKNINIEKAKFNLLIKSINNNIEEYTKGIVVESQNKIIFELNNISLFDLKQIILNKVT